MSENLNETDIREEISPRRSYCGQFSEMKFKTSIFKQYYLTNLKLAVQGIFKQYGVSYAASFWGALLRTYLVSEVELFLDAANNVL